MTKLMDIKGYWNTSDDWNFDEKDMYEGQILLDEDGWFEGIVNNPYSDYKLDRFVFGAYFEGKVIFLNKLTPLEGSTPFIFSGDYNDGYYWGEFDYLGLAGNYRCGNMQMASREVEHNLESQKQELVVKLENFKKGMNKYFAEMYQNMLAVRKEFTEEVLEMYNERKSKESGSKRVRN